MTGPREGRGETFVVGEAPGAFSRIQSAINVAADGDTVLVLPGTYVENIDFIGKDIVLRSEQGPEQTILDGNRLGPVVIFKLAEGRGAVVEGFTITRGQGTTEFSPNARGGGVMCYNASPIIRDNIIVENEATLGHGGGGGIAVGTGLRIDPRPSPLIERNIIEHNMCSGNGGGISLLQSDAEVKMNVLRFGQTLRVLMVDAS
jgi:hypothetical protein